MKKAATVFCFAAVLFLPLLLTVAAAVVSRSETASACTLPVSSGDGTSFRIGTLNWRGASHHTKDPHRGERPFFARAPHMVDKVNASGASIIGFQEFEPPQARAFLQQTSRHWALARGRVHGRADTRDAIAYQPSSWTVAQVRFVTINYGGSLQQMPFVRFSSRTGLGDLWVLNTHNPADVINGSRATRDAAVRAEAGALRAQQAISPATPLIFLGDMNDRARFAQRFFSLTTGWSTANPTSRQIDWIMGSPTVRFDRTVIDHTTNDHAHSYTDHPFVHTAAIPLRVTGKGFVAGQGSALLLGQQSAAGEPTPDRVKAGYASPPGETLTTVICGGAGAGIGGQGLPAGMTGTGDFTPNTSFPYVGPFSPGELVARMRKIEALNGSGKNLDPFFGTEPDGSWWNDCQHFVANLSGRPASGYPTASFAWSHFRATGAAHPAASTDGMSPPAGAWLYYGHNHVVVYLGRNLVAGTDTWGTGTAKIGPAADVQRWLASQGGYRGWAVPWGSPQVPASGA